MQDMITEQLTIRILDLAFVSVFISLILPVKLKTF